MFPALLFLLVAVGGGGGEEILDPSLDPGLLQAVLADPVLLQAVDPRVLQAVLVTAAAANLVNTEEETQSELAEFEGAEDFSLEPRQSSTTSQSGALGHKLGGAFSLGPVSQSGLGQAGQQPSQVGNINRFGSPAGGQAKLGGAFSNVASLASPSQEFPQQNTRNLFSGSNFHNQAQAPQFSSQDRKIFGTAFNTESQTNIIGPQQPQSNLPALNTDVELISQNKHVATSEKLRATNHLKLNEENVLRYLRNNPDILQQFSKLQLGPGSAGDLDNPVQSERLEVLPSVLPPGPGAGVCSLLTANGIPCDPGLAFSPLTGSCEWPDRLIETGCNPEVVTGFGPCPQHIEDPGLNPAQVYGWPYPKFPVTPAVVAAYNFDAVLAKKYFIVCVPTVYDKLFPRLICCPDHQFFDPFHIDGCIYPLPPPPPPPQYLPSPF